MELPVALGLYFCISASNGVIGGITGLIARAHQLYVCNKHSFRCDLEINRLLF